MEKKMSVHQALSEVKTYDDRINRGISSQFVVANRKNNAKIGSETVEEVKEKLKGNLMSVKALIENKKIIKSAIVKSNNTTTVKVGGKDYFVAEAIERKNMVVLEENLLHSIADQYNRVKGQVDKNNDALPEKLENYLKSALTDKTKVDETVVKVLTDKFMGDNEYEMIDPNKINLLIDVMYKEISDFKTEVDYKLSESNATTIITVNLVD